MFICVVSLGQPCSAFMLLMNAPPSHTRIHQHSLKMNHWLLCWIDASISEAGSIPSTQRPYSATYDTGMWSILCSGKTLWDFENWHWGERWLPMPWLVMLTRMWWGTELGWCWLESPWWWRVCHWCCPTDCQSWFEPQTPGGSRWFLYLVSRWWNQSAVRTEKKQKQP